MAFYIGEVASYIGGVAFYMEEKSGLQNLLKFAKKCLTLVQSVVHYFLGSPIL